VAARARVRVAPVTGETSRLALPDDGLWTFDWVEGSPRWREPPAAGQGRILEAVAAALLARGIRQGKAMEVSLDTRAFRTRSRDGRDSKLGLGSSAAVIVALAAALLAQAGRPAMDREALAELCMEAHRRFQEGRGSGLDVTTSVHGGVITFAATADGTRIRPLTWPPGLHWIAAWTGASASTTAMLARLDAFQAADPARFEQRMAELCKLASATVAAWVQGEVAAILQAFADYDDALRAFDDGAQIGIYTPIHQRLAEMSSAAGAVYKISGAGGGDFGIAFADSADVIAGAARAFADQGVLTLAGVSGAPGVTVS
jgi:phosphomevalonate kinase